MRTELAFRPKVTPELEEAVNGPWPTQLHIQPDGSIVESDMKYPDMIGDRTLPVSNYAQQIAETFLENQYCITRSPTGSGKSTGMAFMDSSVDLTILTQPRVIAAREIASRLACILTASGMDGGRLAGYDTANEGNATADNIILVTTHGLAWQQITHGKYDGMNIKVLNDEHHERDAYQDPLLEECVMRGIKTVIASATIDVDRTAAYMARRSGLYVPILDLPGSPFKVEKRDSGKSFADAIIDAARQGRADRIENDVIMGIVPSVKDVQSTIDRMRQKLPKGMQIFPVYGDMTPEQQSKCFSQCPEGKVVIGTSILQTSLTVPGARYMVDSGYARTGNWVDGVRSIPIRVATYSEMIQRMGRVGRTCDGVYEIAELEGYPPLPRLADGQVDTVEFDTPQLLRTDPTPFILRYAELGRDMRRADLPDQVPQTALDRQIGYLKGIGAFSIEGSNAIGHQEITLLQFGEAMSKIPIDTVYAAMIVEARKVSPELGLQMMAAGAACQVQGIVSNDKNRQLAWRRLVPDQNSSDIIAQLQLFIQGLGMTPEERTRSGFIEARFRKAKIAFEGMAEQLGYKDIRELHLPTNQEQALLRGCIIAAAPEIFVKIRPKRYRDMRGDSRELSDTSVLGGWNKLIVGIPFNLERLSKNGPSTKRIIVQGTEVSAHELLRYAPHKITHTVDGYELDESGAVKQQRKINFNGVPTRESILADIEPSIQTKEYLMSALLAKHASGYRSAVATALYDALDELEDLQNRTDQSLKISRAQDIIQRTIRATAEPLFNLEEAAKLVPVASIRSLVDEQQRADILANSPDELYFEIDGIECFGEVTYSKNSAIIILPVHMPFLLPKYFPELGNREILVRFGAGREMTLEEARQQYILRQERRNSRHEVEPESPESVITGDGIVINPDVATNEARLTLRVANAPDKRGVDQRNTRWGRRGEK